MSKKKKYNFFDKKDHTGIIHDKRLYTINSDGKRKNKKSCVYYEKNSEKCLNQKCHVSICVSASKCDVYKRKNNKDSLSEYDENYVIKPLQSSIHDNNVSSVISRKTGTTMHIGFLKSDGKRRHKAKCIYYERVQKTCKKLVRKCVGSSHCKWYKEK